MRILFLTSRLPYPPNRGDRLRAFNFLKQLATEHEITLISFIADPEEQKHRAVLEKYCQQIELKWMKPRRSVLSVLLNFWRGEPLQALYYRLPAMDQLVNEVLASNNFDLAYIHLFRMAPYMVEHTDLYRIVDLTDVISTEVQHSLPYRGLASRLLYTIERPRIERFERWAAENFEETWLISPADQRLLAEKCPNANLLVIPNGVDTERFFPTGEQPIRNSMIFVGHLGVFHNIDAAEYLAKQILPRVQAHIPDSSLRIVGAEPAPQIRRLDEDPAVTVTGFVPDLNAELNRAAVFVAPLRFAAGIQNKVLEAMAAGRPVVTSPMINQGLGAKPNEEIILAEGPEETARQIIHLLQNDSERRKIGEAGKQFVQMTYRWDQILARVRTLQSTL
jgi:sugar transferase (PEP-CTERM/EpsH1 system associated)